jgi:hypothetical protein
LFVEVAPQFFRSGQFKLVLGHKKPVVHPRQGILNEGVVLPGAQQDADGWLIALDDFMGAIIADILISP